MIVIRLRFFGPLKNCPEGDRFEVELPPGAQLRDLLSLIGNRWGDKLPAQFWDVEKKRFAGGVLVMSGNLDIDDPDMALIDRQEIYVVQPIGGG